MMKRIAVGVIIFLLMAFSFSSLVSKGELSLPPKLVMLFILLFTAAIALKLKMYWTRFPILLSSIAYLGFYEGSCLCPNGALQNIFLFLGMSKFSRIGLYVFELTVIFGIVFLMGNLYCGWVCHKGGVQEFLFRQKLAVRVPEKVDHILRNLRFVVLGIIIVYPLLKQEKLFGKIDPFKTLFNLDGSITLVILLGFVLLTSIFIYRPYCRYFCPFGAVLGAVNALGFFKLQFNGVCTACRICEKSCMFDALKAKNLSSPVVDKTICIACMECTRACPKKVLEENKILGKKRDFQADLVV